MPLTAPKLGQNTARGIHAPHSTAPSMRDQLSVWLAANRSRRCTLIDDPVVGETALLVGETGVITLKMAAGSHHELGYLRGAPQQPSMVSHFLIEALDCYDLKRVWKGEVAKTLDDVMGSPRVRLPWGPVLAAAEYLVTVRLGDRVIEGSPLRVRVRAAPRTVPSTSSIHLESEAGALLQSRRLEPLKELPPLPPVQLVAGEEGRFILAPRDEHGNLREDATSEDQFYVTLRLEPNKAAVGEPPLYMPPPAGASASSAAPPPSMRIRASGEGLSLVSFIRPQVRERARRDECNTECCPGSATEGHLIASESLSRAA